MSAGVGDTDDSPQGVAQVRDGRPGIEVLVVQRDIDGVVRTLPWLSGSANRAIPTVEPDWYLAKVVATCTLGLPAAMCHPGVADAVIASLERNYFPGWQDAYYSRASSSSSSTIRIGPRWPGLISTTPLS